MEPGAASRTSSTHWQVGGGSQRSRAEVVLAKDGASPSSLSVGGGGESNSFSQVEVNAMREVSREMGMRDYRSWRGTPM